MLIEKAISSNNYNIYFLLLYTSKAFDTMNSRNLLKDLQGILGLDELNIMPILVKDVSLKVNISTQGLRRRGAGGAGGAWPPLFSKLCLYGLYLRFVKFSVKVQSPPDELLSSVQSV